MKKFSVLILVIAGALVFAFSGCKTSSSDDGNGTPKAAVVFMNNSGTEISAVYMKAYDVNAKVYTDDTSVIDASLANGVAKTVQIATGDYVVWSQNPGSTTVYKLIDANGTAAKVSVTAGKTLSLTFTASGATWSSASERSAVGSETGSASVVAE